MTGANAPFPRFPVDPNPPQGIWGRGPRSADEWEMADEEDVAFDDLYATHDRLNTERVAHYLSGGDHSDDDQFGDGRTLPRVAEEDGRFFIIDGHHRLTAALGNGDTTAQVIVWRDH